MIYKIDSISISGTWDFNRMTSDQMQYDEFSCFSLVDNIINCRQVNIDLNRGMLLTEDNYSVPLKAALFINDGYVVNRFDYPNQEGDYVQIMMKNGQPIKVHVLEERLFLTNFNQQYLLGNYDRRYFEEVYNNFPAARVLKVKKSTIALSLSSE